MFVFVAEFFAPYLRHPIITGGTLSKMTCFASFFARIYYFSPFWPTTLLFVSISFTFRKTYLLVIQSTTLCCLAWLLVGSRNTVYQRRSTVDASGKWQQQQQPPPPPTRAPLFCFIFGDIFFYWFLTSFYNTHVLIFLLFFFFSTTQAGGLGGGGSGSLGVSAGLDSGTKTTFKLGLAGSRLRTHCDWRCEMKSLEQI